MNARIFLIFSTIFVSFGCSIAKADMVLTSGFFSGAIQSYDVASKAETTFAFIGGNPGLSGLAYSQAFNTVYASALNHGGVYRFDARTGSLLGFSSLGIGPGGLAVSISGNVYVSDFTSNSVRIYDSSLANLLGTISTPSAPTSGVGFLNNGDVLIATAGSGVFRFDGNSVTPFSANPAASAQIATDSNGNTIIGHGLGFADSAFRFDANGNILGTIDVTPGMVNSTGNGSSSGTSPSGVAFDRDGNLYVAVLGQSNPGDIGGERGGLFKFDISGNLLDTYDVGSRAYSSVVYISAVPEPSSYLMLAVAAGSTIALRRFRRKRN